jgi:hypothetical protein
MLIPDMSCSDPSHLLKNKPVYSQTLGTLGILANGSAASRRMIAQ